MNHVRRIIGPLFALAMFAAAVWLLRHELRHHSYRDVRDSLLAMPHWRLAAGALLVAANYLVLIGYDLLAVRYLRHPLGIGKVALVSFVGHVSAFNFGGLLGGTSVRYRLYSAWGLSAVEIVKLIMLAMATFWTGYLALAGVVFLLQPLPLPAFWEHRYFSTAAPLGVILICLAIAYLAMCALRREPLRWREWEFPIPPFRLAAAQLAVASFDLLVGAGSLYVLLPGELGIGYWQFLAVYLLAILAVLFTHVPGGFGVLELLILWMLDDRMAGGDYKAAVVGSLIAYRVLYNLIPLLFATVLMAGHELFLQRELVGRAVGLVGRWAPAIAPRLLSLLMVLAGAMLLFSGALPSEHSRLGWMGRVLPLGVIEASHFLGSVSGIALLLLARGLQRRLDSAYLLTAAVLVAGIAFSLLKGFNYEEAIVLGIVLAVLLPCHRYFYRHAALIQQRFTPDWIAAIAAVVIGTVWLGMFSFKHLEFSNDLWWRFALHGDASRFLRASVGVAVALVAVGLARLLRYAEPAPRLATVEELQAARAIVEASPKVFSNLALVGDKGLLFNAARTAFVMYGLEGRSWVALGDPIGPAEERAELVWAFRELSEYYGGWTIFYQIEQEQIPLYLDLGLQLLKLGEEARVPLADFSLEGSQRKDLRHTLARAERAGCQFEVATADQVPELLPEFWRISDDWLASKNTREKSFSLGHFDEHYLRRFPAAVIRSGGQIVAFANIWRGAEQEELSVDLMRFSSAAPGGVMDFLFIQLMLWGRQQGYRWFSLGMAPLSGLDNRALAPLWARMGAIVFRHGEHFYNFQGLRQYKAKFDPVWTPKYLASPGGLALPRILTNIATLISGSLPGVLAK